LTDEQAHDKLALDKKAFRKEFSSFAAREMALQRYDRALTVRAMLRGQHFKRRRIECI
jgi:hypothetical protein